MNESIWKVEALVVIFGLNGFTHELIGPKQIIFY
jgi:hypothetical protein